MKKFLIIFERNLTIKGNNKNLICNCRRLVGIGSEIKYIYNEDDIRIKKEIPNSVTTFKFDG